MKITKDLLLEKKSLSGGKLSMFKKLISNGWSNQDAYDAVTDDKAYSDLLKDPKYKEIADKQQKEQQDKKELDDYNNEITSDEANTYSIQAVEKMFNNSKFRTNKEFKRKALGTLARNYDEHLNLKTASKVLTSYKPEFIKSWADSFNWQAVADKNEPFVQALNNPDVAKLLNGDETKWVKLYNILYDSDAQGYADQPGTLIGNPNLYRIKNQNEAKQLVKVDIKDGGKHRQGFNKRLDTGNYGEILSLGKKIGVEDSSNKLINTIKNNSNNLSSEEKVTAAKALKLGKPELKKLSDDLDNANNN